MDLYIIIIASAVIGFICWMTVTRLQFKTERRNRRMMKVHKLSYILTALCWDKTICNTPAQRHFVYAYLVKLLKHLNDYERMELELYLKKLPDAENAIIYHDEEVKKGRTYQELYKEITSTQKE